MCSTLNPNANIKKASEVCILLPSITMQLQMHRLVTSNMCIINILVLSLHSFSICLFICLFVYLYIYSWENKAKYKKETHK